MWGAIGGAISGAMNPKFCFVAGTFVMTKQGLQAINKIKVGKNQMSRGTAHRFKTNVLKNPSLGHIDKTIAHYDIYQDAANKGRLWLNYKSDKTIWIDTFEYLKDIIRR